MAHGQVAISMPLTELLVIHGTGAREGCMRLERPDLDGPSRRSSGRPMQRDTVNR